MATLADELQNDFADSGSEDEEGNQQDDAPSRSSLSPAPGGGTRMPVDGADKDSDNADETNAANDDDDDDEDGPHPAGFPGEAREETEARLKAERRSRETPADMRKVTHFMKSMEPVLEKIAYYESLPSDQQASRTAASASGLVEDNPEYQLLTKSNTFSTSVDDHAIEVHKYIRDHYSTRFPELETLLPDPLEYTKAVAIIGNGPMDSLRDLSTTPDNPVKQPLNGILSRPKLMTITVEATTTKGVALSASELDLVQQACTTMLRLEAAKKTLTDFVQSRMNLFAPNLTRLIGSLIAAQLLNARGGLTALAETASSNISSIGSKRPAHSGFATNVGVRNQGYLYDCDLVRRQRPELRTQAMRIVSAKVVLAARVDRVHQSADGSAGASLREQCEKRLDDLIKIPPNKGARALPAPDDKPAKKRGGRRARKAKEATALTDIRRAQNRMAFGKEEAEVGYGAGETTAGLGMVGQSNEGRVRALQVDQRTRAKLSKKNQGWGAGGGAGTASSVGGGGAGAGAASSLRGFGPGSGAGSASVLKGHGLRTSGVGTSLGGGAGTASSLNFTPKQGLELVDPKVRAEMERKGKLEEDRWFRGGTFTQIGGGAVSSAGQASNGAGAGGVAANGLARADSGFKVPALPAKRKLDSSG